LEFPKYGGQVRAILRTAKEVHKMQRFLYKKAAGEPFDFPVEIACYGFDLQCQTEELVLCRKAKNTVTMYADYRTTIGAGTREQCNRLRQLQAAGVSVFLASGNPLQPEYLAAGRTARGGVGILHAKVCCVGRWLVHGSANFTTSTRCNVEFGSLIYLSGSGRRAMDAWFAQLRQRSQPLTLELIEKGDENRERADERRRSKSASRAASRSPTVSGDEYDRRSVSRSRGRVSRYV